MRLQILLFAIVVLLAALLWRISQPPRPDPRMVALAVRATVHALPTPTPYVLEVTRVVEVTRIQEATALPAAPTATATFTPTATPTIEPEAFAPAAGPAPEPMLMSASAGESAKIASTELQPSVEALDVVAGLSTSADVGGACPTSSGNQYATIPLAGGGLTYPDGLHADLNLTLRGYAPVQVDRNLFNKNGPVDGDAPQLAGMFADGRLPGFAQLYQVYDWNWGCGEQGCRGEMLSLVEATLLELQTNRGETIGIPHRNAQIYGGGFIALVLYAEPTRITLGYTREDTVANGYTVHIENVCVDPNLLAAYQGSNGSGRGSLPALHNDDVLGMAGLGNIAVAIRDRGVFFDPRSRLDWWHGY